MSEKNNKQTTVKARSLLKKVEKVEETEEKPRLMIFHVRDEGFKFLTPCE